MVALLTHVDGTVTVKWWYKELEEILIQHRLITVFFPIFSFFIFFHSSLLLVLRKFLISFLVILYSSSPLFLLHSFFLLHLAYKRNTSESIKRKLSKVKKTNLNFAVRQSLIIASIPWEIQQKRRFNNHQIKTVWSLVAVTDHKPVEAYLRSGRRGVGDPDRRELVSLSAWLPACLALLRYRVSNIWSCGRRIEPSKVMVSKYKTIIFEKVFVPSYSTWRGEPS